MKVIGVIPARYSSTRFEGKLLVDICGKPVIQHTFERAKKSKKIQRLIIATDDIRIKNACLKFTNDVVMTSQNFASGTDRVAEVVKKLRCNVIINIQGDEPLIDYKIIDDLVDIFLEDRKVVMATAICKMKEKDDFFSPDVVKVVIDKFDNAIYFSRSPIPYHRNKGKLSPYKHIGIYGYRKNFLINFCKLPPSPLETIEGLEQLRAIENGYKIKVIKCNYEGIGVDIPEDIKKVEKLLLQNKTYMLTKSAH